MTWAPSLVSHRVMGDKRQRSSRFWDLSYLLILLFLPVPQTLSCSWEKKKELIQRRNWLLFSSLENSRFSPNPTSSSFTAASLSVALLPKQVFFSPAPDQLSLLSSDICCQIEKMKRDIYLFLTFANQAPKAILKEEKCPEHHFKELKQECL